MLYLRIIKDKYIKIYNEFILQLHIYAKAVRILAKGYLPIMLIAQLKLQVILNSNKEILIKNKSRLWYSNQEIAPILWYEISYFQHRQT